MSRKVPQEPNPERKDFLTARQLAAVLQVSESTVRRLANQGSIPSLRLSSRLIRFHLTAVRHALDVAARNRLRNNPDEKSVDDTQLSFDDLL